MVLFAGMDAVTSLDNTGVVAEADSKAGAWVGLVWVIVIQIPVCYLTPVVGFAC